jgi:hypothetical protein
LEEAPIIQPIERPRPELTNYKLWFKNSDSVPTLPEPTKSRFEDEFRLLSKYLNTGPGIQDAGIAIFSWCYTEGQLISMESVCFLNF